MSQSILNHIDTMADDVVELQRRLVSIPALGPDNDGEGEKEKAEYLKGYLQEIGIPEISEIKAPDNRVPCGYRPSVVGRIPGQDTSKTLWIISHIDVVPSGDLSLWNSDPFELLVEGDILRGRGVEDNHGGIVPSLILAKALLKEGEVPPLNLGLLLVADEETGSHYGLDYVVQEHADIFADNDLFLVPDFGTADSRTMEIAEKSMLWTKVSVYGKQCHASTPDEGVNSLVAASDFILRVKELHKNFPASDPLFAPPTCTFTPTRKDANVPNVNTIPGLDVFYIDSRVLPEYDIKDVYAAIKDLGKGIETEHGVRIEYELVMSEQAAPPTSATSEVVERLAAGIKAVYGVEGKPAGVGGGTVAAFLRRSGREAVVWATCEHNAHQPNEMARISSLLGDAKVMGSMLYAK